MHTKGSRQWRSCQVAIEQKPTSMDREAVDDLSSRQKVSRWIKNLSRSYRDIVQKAWWIEIALTSTETRRKKGSIDSNLSRDVEKMSRLFKNSFSKKLKNTDMNAIKHATQLKIQTTFKLSKSSLKKKMLSTEIKKKKKTHAHTLNKSNQFYISRKVKIV